MRQRIFEAIVTTLMEDGKPHIVPLGIRHEGEAVVLMPFRPSCTLENIIRERHAIVSLTDDVRIFAGSLTGRYAWPMLAADKIPGVRLAAALAHLELQLDRIEDDPVRPRLLFRQVWARNHAPFCGFNRAQAAIVEACILVSRLSLLTEDKIRNEIAFLSVPVEKTAGPSELEAWNWLIEKIDTHYSDCSTPQES